MKSIVELDIEAPRGEVAALYGDPSHSTSWMDDVERYEPLSGAPGMPGSTYRLVPKRGDMIFIATVLSRDLPREVRLRLDAARATVLVTGTLSELPAGRTQLVSEEIFEFKGFWNGVLGLLAQPAIRRAHRRHMEAFKQFAERKYRNSQRG